MNYLDFEQIKPMINKGKTIEQFIGFTKSDDFSTLKWISLYLNEEEYCVDFHEVFDDRKEGIENIYDFPYVEPDDMYGKRMHQTVDFESLTEWIFNHFSVSRDRFLPFDFLNEELGKEK
ncbi:hypothetical protein MMU07_09260 [Aquiflexum sp. LQ15W]|uniref:hypothetical protein n=1 Tax=Cognataquiflexum nitidum TaxID=2922272 RepID=UPI001F1445D9|nr:hypothetical protein [Cognataquiflexum nitidum]MCH6199768.1 hypothetical protein [Cognataquiflexum nitidum]